MQFQLTITGEKAELPGLLALLNGGTPTETPAPNKSRAAKTETPAAGETKTPVTENTGATLITIEQVREAAQKKMEADRNAVKTALAQCNVTKLTELEPTQYKQFLDFLAAA